MITYKVIQTEFPLASFTVRTSRLLLRPITLEDAADLFAIRADPELNQYQNYEAETSISQTREWIQRRLKGDLCCVIELAPPSPSSSSSSSSNGISTSASTSISASHEDSSHRGLPPSSSIRHKVIGTIGSSNSTGLPNLGYVVGRVHWGKGYASEALQGLVDAYWREYPSGYPGLEGDDRDTLKADTRWNNHASQGVLAKCGFERCGEKDGVDGEGKRVAYYYYRVRRPGTSS